MALPALVEVGKKEAEVPNLLMNDIPSDSDEELSLLAGIAET